MSRRLRFGEYLALFRRRRHQIRRAVVFRSQPMKIVCQPGHLVGKMAAMSRGTVRRVADPLGAWNWGLVFVDREALKFARMNSETV